MNAWIVSIHKLTDIKTEETVIERYLVHATTEAQAKAWFVKNIPHGLNNPKDGGRKWLTEVSDWQFATVQEFNLDVIVKLN